MSEKFYSKKIWMALGASRVHHASCNSQAKNQRVELTPWDLDLLPAGPIQRGLVFPKPKHSQEEETDENTLIDHLRTSLSRTLDYFPLLAGRLAATDHDDDTVSFFIDCNKAGALFIHAEADGVTISDIVKPVYVPSIVHSFFPLNGMKNYEGISKALLGVQVTELVDGIFVGCTMNHSVADGTFFWCFINSWSEISREDAIPPPLKERIFHFSKQSIARLKAKANLEVSTNNISSLQAILSHFWRSIIRNKNVHPFEEMSYYMITGAGQRLQRLPKQYFGNALKRGSIIMKAKEVQEQGVGQIAREMNRIISKQTEEEFIKDLESWIASPRLPKRDWLMRNIMATSSSPRFNVYGNDFGWGRPIAARSGSVNHFDGMLTLLCGAEEGSIEVEACLSPETLDAMANDHEFMETVWGDRPGFKNSRLPK
ncbi:hypothetical protein DITRI_Ditri18aG0088600 [Diplodiscus trichospermus]